MPLITDPRHLDPLRTVIGELHKLSGIEPHGMMVIGASCRDILHASYGHEFVLRATRDVDVAIALSEWESFDRLTKNLQPAGHTGIRYLVRGITVDLLPFGEVEDPPGVVAPASRSEDMDVFALQDVFDHSSALSLGHGLQVRIPSAAGYCALKLSAWVNRSATGEMRDAPDIAASLYWYVESQEVLDRLYDTDEGGEILTVLNYDASLGAAWCLGRDIAAELGSTRVQELRRRWSDEAQRRLAPELGGDTIPGWPVDLTRRAQFIDALCSGVWG